MFTSFIIQASTGSTLTLYYCSTVTEAFASVKFILIKINLGWFLRSVHRWSAGVMVLTLVYMCRECT